MNLVLESRQFTFALICCWLVLVTAASIAHRRLNKLPLFSPSFDKILFFETWRSGHSSNNLFIQFGGARNCLWVVVADGRLQVSPHFPFNLGFAASVWKLEFSVSGSSIKSVERRSGIFGEWVRITFEQTPGIEEKFDLRLGAPTMFIAAVESIRQ